MPKYISFLICAISLLLVSCETKQSPIEDLKSFTEELETNSKEYSKEEWQAADNQFQQIETELDKHRSEYTDDELKEIGKNEGKCLAIFTKQSAKDFKENLNDALQEATGVAEGLAEGIKEE